MINLLIFGVPVEETKYIRLMIYIIFILHAPLFPLLIFFDFPFAILDLVHLACLSYAFYKIKKENDYTGLGVKLFTLSTTIFSQVIAARHFIFTVTSYHILYYFMFFIQLVVFSYYIYWLLIATKIVTKDDHEFSEENSG